ncbi:MAG: ATP-binding cassette domain-containing protein, partial [Bacteroidales bacterium]
MNQSFIDALMHFFSLLLLPLPGKKIGNMRAKLEDYITKAGISFPIEECLKIYNTYSGKYFFELSSNAYSSDEEINKIQRHLILEAGQKSQENLYLQERILVILSLLEFNKLKNENDENFYLYVQELSRSLSISESHFNECRDFISGDKKNLTKKDLLLEEIDESEELEGEWVTRNIPSSRADKKKKILDKVLSNIRFHFFDDYFFIAFIYTGNHNLFINEKRTYPEYFYSFRRKDILQFEGLEPITFDEIEEHFETSSLSHKIVLSGKDIFYRYENTNYSIKPFSFHEESGQIIGIIGNNGTGKTTILKLIS